MEQLGLSAPGGAVVIGGYVNALGLARGLAARGIETAVVSTKPFDIAQHSRAVSTWGAARDIEDQPEQLAELLEGRAGDWGGWVLMPTNEAALVALAAHRERLESVFRVAVAPPEAVRVLLDKEAMLEEASGAGLDTPHRYGPATEETAALPDIEFPVVVKPLVPYRFVSRFGRKLFVATDREGLRRCVARMCEARIPGQVIEHVPGSDSAILAHCTYIDAAGEPVGGLTVRKLRQNPPLYGDARVAELATAGPDLHEQTVELLRRIGHRGPAITEFKVDARDGRTRFIEVNGRSVVYNGLLRRGGMNLGALTWCDHARGSPGRVDTNRWPGAWIHLHPDVLYSTLHREHRLGMREFLAPYRRQRLEAVWSPSDPAPFLAQWGHTAREGALRLRRSSLQERLSEPAGG